MENVGTHFDPKAKSYKKVILIVIDSLRPAALKKCIEDGTVPALDYLCQAGRAVFNCVSVFPTMTPSAAATIATGALPGDHQIPGFVWYNREERRIVNYGATPLAIWKIGLKTVMEDFLCNLNGRHLDSKVRTIYEILENRKFRCANLNFFMLRGNCEHMVQIPWWARWWTGVKKIKIRGPAVTVVGQLIPPAFRFPDRLKKPQGLRHKLGVNDEFTGTVASHLIRYSQPDFTVVYLPDTDAYTHRHHTDEISPAVVKADRQVQKILNTYSSWTEALAENIMIVLGDHSQSQVGSGSQSIIDLPQLLGSYRQLRLGERDNGQNQLAVCPNERMAHIYILNKNEDKLKLVGTLCEDTRIDHIIWKEARTPIPTYHILRGGGEQKLTFRRSGPLTDQYGSHWTVVGDISTIDAKVNDRRIIYHQYPDALNTVASLLNAKHCGDVVLTARLGFEFGGEAAPIHPGKGSHGSFHREDSEVPLIIAGTSDFPKSPRLVDLVPFILKNFNIDVNKNQE